MSTSTLQVSCPLQSTRWTGVTPLLLETLPEIDGDPTFFWRGG